MSVITRDIPDLLKINFRKARSDDYCSRFHRLFVSRIFALAALATGMYWYHGSLSCDTKGLDADSDYLKSVCWMTGLYIFPQLSRIRGGDHVSLSTHIYGIPDDLDDVAARTDTKGTSCDVSKNSNCELLIKRKFTTYIWVPFIMTAFVLAVSLPYYISKLTSAEAIRFAKDLATTSGDKGAESLYEEYFAKKSHTYKYVLHKLPPLFFLITDVFIMATLSKLLDTNFWEYGNLWLSYDDYENRNLKGAALYPMIPDDVFPQFGLCSIHSKHNTKIRSTTDNITFVCEVSPHVFYRYSFVFIWLALVVGVVCCSIQIVYNIMSAIAMYLMQTRSVRHKVNLTMMQCEFLAIIKSSDLLLYKRVKDYIE